MYCWISRSRARWLPSSWYSRKSARTVSRLARRSRLAPGTYLIGTVPAAPDGRGGLAGGTGLGLGQRPRTALTGLAFLG
jgi:hypothetical protein